ncbi:MAG: hypothetical protein JWP51_1550 [Bradyrhizobium sp.]|nr:hypothetical protein [Bradyrhizobium sp.]
MPENRFDGQPVNGTQVALTSSGSAITPHRVIVTENGRLVRETDFASKADAQRAYDQEQKAAVNAKRP